MFSGVFREYKVGILAINGSNYSHDCYIIQNVLNIVDQKYFMMKGSVS